jgi:hypothetical protein
MSQSTTLLRLVQLIGAEQGLCLVAARWPRRQVLDEFNVWIACPRKRASLTIRAASRWGALAAQAL